MTEGKDLWRLAADAAEAVVLRKRDQLSLKVERENPKRWITGQGKQMEDQCQVVMLLRRIHINGK